ncbi:MAG TPA: hypothetical protein VJU80_03635, partial [Solirubrobacteraceae bacterium]|nr:hypothetical protein [Solirubrobacteraceae bacterium]
MTVLPGDTAWTTVTSSSLAPALVLGGALEIGRGAWGVSAEYRSEHTRSHLTSASYRPTYPGLSTFLILDRNVRQVHGALSVVRRIPMPQWGVGVAPSLGWQE